jgi:hypothetical protein
MALLAHVAVPLDGFEYRFERASSPGQQLCRHAAKQLGLPPVYGRFLASVDWFVPVCPVRLDQLTMHAEDYRLYAAVTRALAVAACQGDRELEARLWAMRLGHGPWVSPGVPCGVLWVERPDDVADEVLSA